MSTRKRPKKVKPLESKIKLVLDYFKLTQVQFAELIGFTQPAVIKWKSGKSEMPLHTRLAYENKLRVRSDWWYEDGEMLVADMGNLSPEEAELIQVFRSVPVLEREFFLRQAVFSAGQSVRKSDRRKG